jgi:N-acetylglucosamine-6-phosphate deacetylase
MIIQGVVPGKTRPLLIGVEGGRFLTKDPDQRGLPIDLGGPESLLSPGFFDPQVNGFGGVDFNERNLDPERFEKAARSLASFGVTHFFPTLITASHERILHQLKRISQALEGNALSRWMCSGIHLEGPYINPEDGPRGVHPKAFIRNPQWDEMMRYQEACSGRIRLITLAPETEGALSFIEKAVSEGIVIGIGHTNASEKVLEDAVRAGARLSTHLGNGAHAILPRHRNPIQKQLSLDELVASIIPDGVHLPDYVVKNFVRAKGVDRILLTTDAMAGAAAPAGRYPLGDLQVDVGSDRVARLKDTPYLAGSTLTMDRAVENVMQFLSLDLSTVLRMAFQNGIRVFPGAGGEIREGQSADFVLFEFKESLAIKSTWVHGERIY